MTKYVGNRKGIGGFTIYEVIVILLEASIESNSNIQFVNLNDFFIHYLLLAQNRFLWFLDFSSLVLVTRGKKEALASEILYRKLRKCPENNNL